MVVGDFMNALVSLSHEHRGVGVSICRQEARMGFVGSINEMTIMKSSSAFFLWNSRNTKDHE
jgi:hypothetical protein